MPPIGGIDRERDPAGGDDANGRRSIPKPPCLERDRARPFDLPINDIARLSELVSHPLGLLPGIDAHPQIIEWILDEIRTPASDKERDRPDHERLRGRPNQS